MLCLSTCLVLRVRVCTAEQKDPFPAQTAEVACGLRPRSKLNNKERRKTYNPEINICFTIAGTFREA